MRNSRLLSDSLHGCDTDVARTTHRSSIAIVVAALLLVAPVAQADWKREYDRGSKAIVDQKWQEAEANFAAAIREDANAKERRRFEGQRYQPYVPQYYAGLAAWRQGACDRAMAYWQSPANMAVIGRLPELKARQDQGLADCQQKLAQASKPTTPTTTTPATTTTTTPATTTATTTPATTTPTTTVAQQHPKPTTPTTPVAQTPKPTTPAPTTAAPAKPTAGAAPAALVGAVEAWIAGRYANVIQADPAAAGDGARAHVLMLRAAARHSQAELAGGDAAQLEQARNDVRAAKAANASLTPDAALFPPRFRTFWQQTR